MYVVRSLLILIFSVIQFTLVAQNAIPKQEDNKWGLVDNGGNWILPPTYEYIGWSDGKQAFTDDIIGYQKNGFWGILNVRGKRITNPLYRSLNYKGGKLLVGSNLGKISRRTLFGLIDFKGKVISSFRYLDISRGYNNQFIVKESIDGREVVGDCTR